MTSKSDDSIKFSQTIEQQALRLKTTHLEALTVFCEENGIEPDMVKKLITPSLKAKLKVEAQTLHYLPGGTDSKLDI